MKAYNELMKYREDYTGHYWNQMVEVNNPALDGRTSYWEDRILQQIRFAMACSLAQEGTDHALIENVSEKVLNLKKTQGYITKEQVLEFEQEMMSLSEKMKAYTVHCVAHAHIDMNWMWGWHETVSVTIDTFRTMLNLLGEYKDFTYSQSQASTYQIIENYCPEMIEEIKQYVHEGRWELAASTWVENDRNMSSGESFARHILYTKNYLSKLFDIDVDTLQLDFEPDCFGHSAHIPEILANGGVKYYYHCRGLEGHSLYKWQSPSGASLLAYREPIWYANSITGNSFSHIPEICNPFGVKDGLYVYGVGDHGGGPTRRDIEKLQDMNTWPIYPTLKFSTYHNYFKAVEHAKDTLPVVDHELNFTLTGCFTSSSRIKMANRYSENVLVDSEYINSMTHALLGRPYSNKGFEDAWQKTLFNQFHDILPGCGINFTREYALGKFQDIMAGANTIRKLELENLVRQIDTTEITSKLSHEVETAEGAGVGVHTRRMIGKEGVSFNLGLSQNARYGGATRLYTLFNHTAYTAMRYVEVMIWDYKEDLNQLAVYNSKGEALNFEKQEDGYNQYWGHWYTRLLVEVALPSYGYETILVTQKEEMNHTSAFAKDSRVKTYMDYTLENDYVRATFDPTTLDMTSLFDKVREEEMLEEGKGAGFHYIKEDGKEANAWIVGRYVAIDDVKRECIDIKKHKGATAESLSYTMKLAHSTLKVTATLYKGKHSVEYHVETMWNEIGDTTYTPQLNFQAHLKQHTGEFIYDVPMGEVTRLPLVEDVPASSFGWAHCQSNYGLYLTSESKYGYRGLQNSLALSLLRSSHHPDTHPENGTHSFDFVIGVGRVEEARQEAALLNHQVDVIGCKPNQEGSLPQTMSFLKVEGEGIIVDTIKKAEGLDQAWIVRYHEVNGLETTVACQFAREIETAYPVDFLERQVGEELTVEGNCVSSLIAPYSIQTLCIKAK